MENVNQNFIELFKKIQEKKAEVKLAEEAKFPTNNRKLKLLGSEDEIVIEKANEPTIKEAYRILAIESMAEKLSGNRAKINNYTIEEWCESLKIRSTQLRASELKEELNKMENTFNSIAPADVKTTIGFETLSNQLDSLMGNSDSVTE